MAAASTSNHHHLFNFKDGVHLLHLDPAGPLRVAQVPQALLRAVVAGAGRQGQAGCGVGGVGWGLPDGVTSMQTR